MSRLCRAVACATACPHSSPPPSPRIPDLTSIVSPTSANNPVPDGQCHPVQCARRRPMARTQDRPGRPLRYRHRSAAAGPSRGRILLSTSCTGLGGCVGKTSQDTHSTILRFHTSQKLCCPPSNTWFPNSVIAHAVHIYDALALSFRTERLQAREPRSHGVE